LVFVEVAAGVPVLLLLVSLLQPVVVVIMVAAIKAAKSNANNVFTVKPSFRD